MKFILRYNQLNIAVSLYRCIAVSLYRCIAVSLLCFTVIVYSSNSFSKNKACFPKSEKTALIIIDMQDFFVKRGGNENTPKNHFKLSNVMKSQLDVINNAKKRNTPIIFIEYDHTSINIGETNSTLKNAVRDYDKVRFFKKNTDGMFDDGNKHRDQLVDYLRSNKIGNLIISGANGGACVYSSIQGALEENCKVIAYNNGIADFNFKDFQYPFAGYYTSFGKNCKNCSIKEIMEIDDILHYFTGNMTNSYDQTPDPLMDVDQNLGGK